ncbi:MAG: histidine phosphatase family protein [Phycisphaerales bacterium]|nr:histidine phosphatase family protein [Phycisphaerales bacterium]
MRVVLIPCAATDWQAEGRLLGRTALSPTTEGQAGCATWLAPLRAAGLITIYHGPDELSQFTARLLARHLRITVRSAQDLAELDVGLWAGLTDGQLRSRFASAHRELCESPLNVTPPGGETVSAAAERLKGFFHKQTRRNGARTIGVVLRPLTWALARCVLEQDDFSSMWTSAQGRQEPVLVETP